VVVSTEPRRADEELDLPLVISIELNDGSRLVTNHKFRYKIDPRFTDIEPRNHLVVYVGLYCVTGILYGTNKIRRPILDHFDTHFVTSQKWACRK